MFLLETRQKTLIRKYFFAIITLLFEAECNQNSHNYLINIHTRVTWCVQ